MRRGLGSFADKPVKRCLPFGVQVIGSRMTIHDQGGKTNETTWHTSDYCPNGVDVYF